MQNIQMSMEKIIKRMEQVRVLQEQVDKIRSLAMDTTEHFHIKCIVLFRTGEITLHVFGDDRGWRV